jgi:anti-anti-sigma factor
MRSKTQILVRHAGDVAIFDVNGSLTEDSEKDLTEAYEQVQAEGLTRMLINFDRHCFITSSGFGLIVKLIWGMRNTDRVLRVSHPSDQTRKTFDVIGLTRSIEVFASEQEALAGF